MLTVGTLCVLLAYDIRPELFPANVHAVFAASPLAMIAVALLTDRASRSAPPSEWLKAILLAAAFFFWAANQWLANPHSALVCNDIAIALFVLDIVLMIAGPAVTDRPKRSCESPTCCGPACRRGGVCC